MIKRKRGNEISKQRQRKMAGEECKGIEKKQA
jgi:hypothetical protein